MRVPSFTDALFDALRSQDQLDGISRIKQVVINELRATDERVSIQKTDYFNHSFVPDMVLNWPGEKESRHLFLRPETTLADLQDDIALSSETRPIFFSLTGMAGKPKGLLAQLDQTSHGADSLVTDSQGIQELISQRQEHPVVRLASSAVLQGARGLLDDDKSAAVAAALTSGLDAAAHVQRERTEAATRTIASTFDSTRSTRLNRLLQAVWIGSGGSASTFPGRYELAAGLDEDALSYLLQLEHVEDFEFWKRIGRRLTLATLSKIRIEHPSANFQALVTANLDVLNSKACRVSRTLPYLTADSRQDPGYATWELDRGMLVYRSDRHSVHVAQRKDELERISGAGSATRFDQLLQRLDGQDIAVTELSLGAGGRTVAYSSDRPINVINDQPLATVASALGASVEVRQLVAAMRGHSPVTCDFPTSIVSGKTTATYPVMDLIELAMTLFADMSNEELLAIEELTPEIEDLGPPTLF
ncbi:hypothetical protein GCM10022267_03840 [Lentzea roselyniae]|uniref:Uncharacterized protein n=1 Tax=Lentzea roselyniae TaxID=531940 RepID=A0ABP6ZYN6_9PSEU